MKRRPPERIELGIEELESILDHATRERLSAEEHAKLKAAVDTLAFLTREIESKGASIQRLRHLMFGAKTETTRSVLGEGTGHGADRKDRVLSAGVRSPRRSGAALDFRTFGGCSAGDRAPRAAVNPADQDGGVASAARRSRASVKFHGIQTVGSCSTASACRCSATR